MTQSPTAWLSYATAASLHRFDTFGPVEVPIHVTLKRGTYATRPGLKVHTTHTLPL